MPTMPADIVNEALDEVGIEAISDLNDGSSTADVARRHYDPILRAMHAAAPWNFARRQLQLNMLGDSSAQYHTNTAVPNPWRFMYEWPTDCVHARYVLGLDAYSIAADGSAVYAPPAWNRPAPFLVTDAPIINDVDSSWDRIEGHSPDSTRVIVTNQLGANLVYTGLVQYPDAWDVGFRLAIVAALAAKFAMPLIQDKRIAMAVRTDQLRIARDALIAARIRDGNEGWTVQDHTPDWMRARTSGSAMGAWCGGGWQAFPFVEDAGGAY